MNQSIHDKASALVWALMKLEPSPEVWIAGSIRRLVDDPGDIDLVLLGHEQNPLLQEQVKLLLREATGKNLKVAGTWRGVHVDILFATRKNFESVLLHLTGSKSLNIKMRAKAKRLGMKLNQYGLWRGDEIVSRSERGIFQALKMPYLHPNER